jgi:precorrin-6Y C5,15-methyltransferase (decarboxylating)
VKKAVTILGIGDDGCLGLSSRAINAVARAQILAGGERQLAFFPEFTGQRIMLKKGIGEVLDRLVEASGENNVCILASGDPLFFGIGALVIQRMGAAHVEILPQPSAMQWAFAKVGLKWDDAALLSVHGRSREGFLTRLRRQAKVACFTDAENSPRCLAGHLLAHGQTEWRAWVCEDLCGVDERVREFTLDELAACTDIAPLCVLILARTDPHWRPPPAIPFLNEDAFVKRTAKKGLITKREVRLLSLAALNLRPTSIVWDIGAGSGSVSIEAAMLAYEGRVYAVEIDPEGVEICRENILAHAVDNVRVIAGLAPDALTELEDPDAVFVGGSKGSMRPILDMCLRRLRPGGRLVVNAITLENVAEAYTALREQGLVPEVTLLNVSRGEPLAGYMRYEALNPIHIFAVTVPATMARFQCNEQREAE